MTLHHSLEGGFISAKSPPKLRIPSLALLGASNRIRCLAMQTTSAQTKPERPEGESSKEDAIHENRPPWREFAGIWQDNPDFDAFLQNVAALRRQSDEAEPRH